MKFIKKILQKNKRNKYQRMKISIITATYNSLNTFQM